MHAHWKEAAGAGYAAVLYSLEPPVVVKNSSVVGGVTNLTYEGLSPGTHYTFVISTVAGPYTSPPLRVSNWTCECQCLCANGADRDGDGARGKREFPVFPSGLLSLSS